MFNRQAYNRVPYNGIAGGLVSMSAAIVGASAATAPVTAATRTNMFWGSVFWGGTDNTVALTSPGRVYIGSAGTTFTLEKNIGGGAWTSSGTKGAAFIVTYEF